MCIVLVSGAVLLPSLPPCLSVSLDPCLSLSLSPGPLLLPATLSRGVEFGWSREEQLGQANGE